MSLITAKQIQILYALGAKTGTLEQGNKDDNLHIIVNRVSGKNSIKELTQKEFKLVADELKEMLPPTTVTLRDEKSKNVTKMITKDQQRTAWALVYKLIEIDKGDKSEACKRLCGTIKKVCKVETTVYSPFKNVTSKMGIVLIENLKRYVSSAEGETKESG